MTEYTQVPCEERMGKKLCWVKPRPSMTMYPWDGKGENPNADKLLCDSCWEEYRETLESMWADAGY